jgi:hypothetical protein
MKIKLTAVVNSALDGRECSISHPPGKIISSGVCNKLRGLRADPKMVAKRSIAVPTRN